VILTSATLRVRKETGGVLLRVRLTPKGGRDRIDSWTRDDKGTAILKVRVSAPPEKGKANAALIALLARELRLAKSLISIRAGETSRLKTVMIQGDSEALAAKFDALGENS
jgi:uncharacterized protein (TIGR00251 family)